MAVNPNVMDFKETWDNLYQVTHYKVPAYKAIADESIKPKLTEGQKFHRTYDTDFVPENMGGDGGYNNQAWSDNDEFLQVNFVKDVSFYIKKLDEFQAHLPLQIKKARKAMNRLFLQIDGDVFSAAYQGAGSVVDDGTIGGTSGNGILPSVGNVQAIFGAAEQALRLNNVIYDPMATFSGQFKLDRQKSMPVAVVSPQVYNILLQYLGGKTSLLGDRVSQNGHIGVFFGFNIFVSNNLAWSGSLVLSVNPTDGDTVTLLNGITNKIGGVSTPQSIVFTFRNTPSVAGDVKIASSAALTITNFVNVLNAPYTTIASGTNTGYVAYSQGALTTTQQLLFVGLTATGTSTNVNVIAAGVGNVPVAASMTSATDVWTSTSQVQHMVFGVSKSISLVIQRTPQLEILQSNPAPGSNNSGRVGRDFVTWVPYGIKVFNDQAPMLVDVQINTSAFATNPLNTFN